MKEREKVIDCPIFLLSADAKYADETDFILIHIPADRLVIHKHFSVGTIVSSKWKERRSSRGESKQKTSH